MIQGGVLKSGSLRCVLTLLFIFVIAISIVLTDFPRAEASGDIIAFSSRLPEGQAVLNEISANINSIVFHLKDLDEFKNSKNTPQAVTEYEKKKLVEIKSTLDSLYSKHSKLRDDFEYLYRDFISIKVKGDLFKTMTYTSGDLEKPFFEMKNADVDAISYEISLLENTVKSKNTENGLIQKEIDIITAQQESAIDSVLKLSAVVSDSAAVQVNIKLFSKGGIADFFVLAQNNIDTSDFNLKKKLLRYYELKLYSLSRNLKINSGELLKIQSEQDRKKEIYRFLKNNSGVVSSKTLPLPTTSELEVKKWQNSRPAAADIQQNFDDSLKKIDQIAEEIKKEQSSGDSASNNIKLKFLNLKLQNEQELLRQKTTYANENEDFSKFLIKVANYSADVARDETESLKKLYKYIQEKGVGFDKEAIKKEIAAYRALREETRGQFAYITNDQKKIESQLTLLRSELSGREKESVEITLHMREQDKAFSREITALKDVIVAIVEVIKKRIALLEKHSENLKKYENLVNEKIKNIDNIIKQFHSYSNEIQERLEIKTFSESYNSFVGFVSNSYYGLESISEQSKKFFKAPENIYFSMVVIRNAVIFSLVWFLAVYVVRRFLSFKDSKNSFVVFILDTLEYFIAFISASMYVMTTIPKTSAGMAILLFILIFAIYRAAFSMVHIMASKNIIDSDFYFRLILFFKCLLFLTQVLSIILIFSTSASIIILCKFIYKVFILIPAIFIFKNYRRRIFSLLYINKHRLRARHATPWMNHFASLYNHVLNRFNTVIFVVLVLAAIINFAGYYRTATYVINSSFLTGLLYSILYIAPKIALTTFDWIFSDDRTLTGVRTYDKFKENAVVYIRIFYKIFFIVIFLIFTLKIWGLGVHYFFDFLASEWAVFLYKKAALIIGVVVSGIALWHLVEKIADDIGRSALSQNTSDSLKKRGITIVPLIKSSAKYVISFFGIYIILKEIGIDVTPIVAGAGIVGLAVGFGSQNLVKDLVSGFFILFEDQYNVGDYITVEGIEGTVEEISVRITKIRDVVGTLHIIPNGAISKISNYSKDYSISRLEISVAYESDFDKVLSVIATISSKLCSEWKYYIIERTKVLGIISFGESDVVIRTQTRVALGKKLDFECELRKRILEGFRDADIEMPYKKIVVLEKNS